ncbi:hypothetical protein CC1G_07456 [Coprinopsis cinerea okayama7|uniref:BTB domain-containing protein n=1 Tax=Coprinopsis cinerea (strain Okayama-7 / 130 / ATCC MYA-4618 / FGSC 9003) TaxID=240176 RepID=A8NB86_COPC7|nr:hypothetical protein CC1G_07456 [Coprinopsis cinerea okayama7\|eukprot:XP_001832085.2 hypothetical protein CC1G_07456 [Coprinopsis cinerea okayama7\
MATDSSEPISGAGPASNVVAQKVTEFYWDAVIIRVEDGLFCVPRYGLVNASAVFSDMLSLPSGQDGPAPVEGTDPAHPIVLEGYKKDEFKCLLRLLYPSAEDIISETSVRLTLSKDQWISVLKLSTIWGMNKIRSHATHRLSTEITLSPTEKIALARAHRVSKWLEEGITALTTSTDPIKLMDMVEAVGWKTAAQILSIRDHIANAKPGQNGGTLEFRRDNIICYSCEGEVSWAAPNCTSCRRELSDQAKLKYSSTATQQNGVYLDIYANKVQCEFCNSLPFRNQHLACQNCDWGGYGHKNTWIRVKPGPDVDGMIKEMFGDEIEEYKDHM